VKNQIKEKVKYFKEIKKIKLKQYFFAIVAISLLILVIGYFHSVSEHPKSNIKFDKNKYLSAGKYFNINNNQFSYIDSEHINTIIKESLNDIAEWINHINSDLKNKYVIVSTEQVTLSTELINALKTKSDEINKNLDELTNEYYFDNQKYNLLKSRKQVIDTFLTSKTIKLIPDFELGSRRIPLVAGKLKFVNYDSNELKFFSESFKPILTRSFLKKCRAENQNNVDLVKTNKELYNQFIKAQKSDIKIRNKNSNTNLRRRRSVIRNEFYAKWFIKLVYWIITFIMFRILLRYYSIIRRKDLPQKTTYNVYFATNISSKIFRFIALLIVIVGMGELIVNIIVSLASGSLIELIKLPYISQFYHLTEILHPIIATISIVISSWFFVLISEWICFITNLYHISFVKTYGEFNDKD